MHEFAIASDILGVVRSAVGSPKRITAVKVSVGVLAGVCAESLTFFFSELAQLEDFGAPELHILVRPAQVHCRKCATAYEAVDFESGCPNCGAMDREIRSGFECVVESISYEED